MIHPKLQFLLAALLVSALPAQTPPAARANPNTSGLEGLLLKG